MKKPNVELKILGNTVIHVLTLREWRELMEVYELGGWKMGRIKGEDSPLHCSYNLPNEKETCVSAGICRKFWTNGVNTQGHISSYKHQKVISVEDFYREQGITKGQRYQIKIYFEDFPNALSTKLKEQDSNQDRMWEFLGNLAGTSEKRKAVLEGLFYQRLAHTLIPVLERYKNMLESKTNLDSKRNARLNLTRKVLNKNLN